MIKAAKTVPDLFMWDFFSIFKLWPQLIIDTLNIEFCITFETGTTYKDFLM